MTSWGGVLTERNSSYNYPVGTLTCMTKDGEKSISIYFQHYKSFTEAADCWYKRCNRVNYDNLFVIIEDGNNITQKIVNEYENLPFYRMAILCGDSSICGRDVIYMKGFTKKNFPGTSVKYRGIFGKRWLDEFDYINFLKYRFNHEKHT